MYLRVPTALVVLSSFLVAASCSDEGDPVGVGDPISIETTALAEAIEGQVYNQQLEATGGSGSHSWVLAAGSLPSGLTLAPGGAISGTATAPGAWSFRVRAADAEGRSATADLSITVVQTLAVHTVHLGDGVVGESYSVQLQAVGGRGTRIWSSTAGGTSPWLTLSSDGVLSGIPSASGPASVAVTVADESGQVAPGSLSLLVLDPLAVAEISLPAATQGRAYAAQLVAIGGNGVYTWSVEGGILPTGVELGQGGALLGTPEDPGAFSFSVRVTDGAARVATRSLSFMVVPTPTIRTEGLPPADAGASYTAQLVATGGTGSYTWSITTGALPSGLTLSQAGLISGTPTVTGSSAFTVRVTDEAGSTDSRTVALVVAEVGGLTNSVAVTGLDGETGSERYFALEVPAGATQLTVSMSGGTGDVDLYVRYGAVPMEFTYDCRPLRQGNEETCTFTSPSAGYWYVMLRGYAAYAGVSLLATHDG